MHVHLKKSLVAVSTVAAVAGSVAVYSAAASADTAVAGTFNAISPTRIVNTRSGLGLPAAIGAKKAATFSAVGAVPGHDADAVAITVTVVDPARGGQVVLYAPDDVVRPNTSTINFAAGQTTPNEVVAEVSGAGTVSVLNNSPGKVDLLVDITGYWTRTNSTPSTPGSLTTVRPARAFDSRTQGRKPVASDSSTSVPIDGLAGVPDSGVSAVAVNITVASPAAGGTLTASASADDQQASTRTSTLHFSKGVSRAGFAIVPVNSDGTISIYNSASIAINFVVDVEGYFTDGTPSDDGAFVPTTPYRAADTRTAAGAVKSDKALAIPVVPGNASLFKSVVVAITEVAPTSAGNLIAWNGTATRPATTTGNFTRNLTTTTTAVVPLTANGSFSIYNNSPGTVQLVVDVEGFILNDTSTSNTPAAAQVHQALARSRTNAAKELSK
jgi:hypothetical protein